MADGSLAISTMPPALPADADYDALCEALMASSRGRWFLEEYAKRNRNADTGLVLDAIARVEAVVRSEQAHQANQGVRIELLEMARTIAQTRADVAEARPERTASLSTGSGTDVFAAAGRLQEVAWTMRERGLDMAMCDQIADLASAILSATSLRNNPNDGRAQKLAEVLRSLERRIEAMLRAAAEPPPSDGSADRIAPELTPEKPQLSAVELPAEATPPPEPPPPVKQDEPAKAVALPEAAPKTAALPEAAPKAAALPEAAPKAAALPEAALSLAVVSEPAPVKGEPEPTSEQPVFDLDPIAVQPRRPPVAVAAPEPPPPAPPPPAAAPAEAEIDDFLLAPLPLPGPVPAPVSDKPADPLAPLRTLSAHELIALFT
jgi:hypothetical protein